MDYQLSLNVRCALDLLEICPAYTQTPIVEISPLNNIRLLIKDETNRMGLGSFKALGGIYAVAKFLLEQWQKENGSELPVQRLTDPEIRSWSNKFTFVCASAGNHGIAVAKGAELFNANSRVHIAHSVPASFAQRLATLGAVVIRSGETYEESMVAAMNDNLNGETLLADSSWPGYYHLPMLVMEGYTVIAEEMRQVFLHEDNWPTHVFLQAGVGGLAASMAFEIRKNWKQQPCIVVVEPLAAPCLFESYKQGRTTTVSGPISSMGRLDCKEPSLIAFKLLKELADDFVCVSDEDALAAADFLAQNNLATTASGAAGLAAILSNAKLDITIPDNSICLAIATEGSS
ncbi:MAG: pyridoxal-phosphate dependent enzyme [Gammaproteobacteria bacterium]|jgi:diaminopropionate ammonia-lyase|tara:strand:- start:888 stop:1925 length:1038 start_codon:yes stop_codon:yes gene_type:complete